MIVPRGTPIVECPGCGHDPHAAKQCSTITYFTHERCACTVDYQDEAAAA